MSHLKRIIISTFGSFGDIHPYMALATELQERGHHPVIATMEFYREKIRNAGLDFAPVRPNIPGPKEQDRELIEKIMEPKTGPKFLMEEVIFPAVRDSYADLLTAVEGADLLLTHPAAPAGPLVGRKTGMPWISTVLAPLSFFSAYDPPVPPFWPWTSKLRVLGSGFMKLFLDAMKRGYEAKAVTALRNDLGIEDYGNPIFDGQHSPTRVLALFSSLFADMQPDWPPQTRITGFCFYDGRHDEPMPAHLARFLEAGSPPIVFTLGSSAIWVARDFFIESIAAAQRLRRRAVLLIGDERNLPERLPEEIIAVDYAPYKSLLPHAAAVVHHGGVGTTSLAMLAGVPTLIVPFAFDQSDNADHARRLGTSRTLYRAQYSAATAARELGELISNSRYAERAAEIGKRLQAESGCARAAEYIEEILAAEHSHSEELVYASGH